MAQYFTRSEPMAVEQTVFKASEFHTKSDRNNFSKCLKTFLKYSYAVYML